MSQAGIVDFEGSHPQVPTAFIANMGTAVPIANTLEILGDAVLAHSVPLQTVASGNTISINVQYASAAASSVATNAGIASFNSAQFTVDANGFVSFTGGAVTESFEVDAFTAPGTNPVVPNGSGMVIVTGGQVAAGTTTNVIRTDSLAANTYTIQIQRSQAVASSTIGDNGVSHFNSTYFTVDANGFVSIVPSSVGSSVTVDTFTAPGTNPVMPNVSGNITITGGQVAAGTTPNVIRTDSLAANTYIVQIQRSQAVATSTVGDNGVSHFNSTFFTVDTNGFVSLNGAAVAETITGNTGGALSPTAGNWNILGTSTAPGTVPVETSGTGSTLTVQVQKAQAIASTNATNVGLAAFNSAFFTVDSNGFVSLSGTAIGETITGNVGGALSPTAGNWNILGTSTAAGATPVQTSGTGSTLTVQVQKAQAIASTNATNVGLAAFNSADFTVDANGFVTLASGSAAVQTLTGNSGGAISPTAGNINTVGTGSITVVGSGSTLTTQLTGLTNHAVQVGAGTATLTQVGPSATAGSVLASNGASSDPSFQTISSLGGITTITGNTGGAESPLSGNFNILGTGSITVVGSANTETVELTGLTNHNVLVGAGTATITNVAPSATAGIPLISEGSTTDPAFGTAVVAGGGTGNTTFTAYSVICAGTTATGAFQNVSGLGSTAQVLTSNGAATLPTWQASSGANAFNSINIQTFTSSGTYTPTSGMMYCIVQCIGGGGAGGGVAATGAANYAVAGGGGAGEYSVGAFSAATIGASQTVTIGAGGTPGSAGANAGGTGGTTSLGALITSVGGVGGGGGAVQTLATFEFGGAGGSGGTGGQVRIGGTAGFYGIGQQGTQLLIGGSGGNSPLGGGLGSFSSTTTGPAASGYGAGGGGSSNGNSQSAKAGGGGGKGTIIITEYIH